MTHTKKVMRKKADKAARKEAGWRDRVKGASKGIGSDYHGAIIAWLGG